MNHTPQCDTCMAGFHACEVCKDGSSYEKAPVPNGPLPYAQPATGIGPGPMNDKAPNPQTTPSPKRRTGEQLSGLVGIRALLNVCELHKRTCIHAGTSGACASLSSKNLLPCEAADATMDYDDLERAGYPLSEPAWVEENYKRDEAERRLAEGEKKAADDACHEEERLNELNDAQRLGQQRSDERRCEAVLFGSATIDEPRDIRCDLAEGHDGRHVGTSTRRVSWG